MKKLFVLFSLLLTACSPMLIEPVASPIPSVTATPTQPSSTPTLQPLPSATSNLQLLPICPAPGNPDFSKPPTSMSLGWLADTIKEYLNQGGDPNNIPEKLSQPEYGNFRAKIEEVDINGDGVDELVFSSGIIPMDSYVYGGVVSALWVYKCENGVYTPIYGTTIGGYEGNPRFVAAEDLNHDGQKELVVRSTWQGSGCLQVFNIIGIDKKYSSPYLILKGEYFPCGTEFALGEFDASGNREIIFEGKSDIRYDSVAGIQRDFIDTYVLDISQTYVLKSHVYLPSPYRVHAIYDAQKIFNKGDIQQAIQLYEQAAHDETLLDVDSRVFTPNWYVENWPNDLPKQDHPKEYVSAFSLFRLVSLYLQTSEDAKAMATLKELESNHPVGDVGSEFTEAATLFVKYSKIGENPFIVCQSVSSMIEHKYPYLDWHFEWSTWTLFNYKNRTLCPYLSENQGHGQ